MEKVQKNTEEMLENPENGGSTVEEVNHKVGKNHNVKVKCEYCDMTAKTYNALQSHMRYIHTDQYFINNPDKKMKNIKMGRPRKIIETLQTSQTTSNEAKSVPTIQNIELIQENSEKELNETVMPTKEELSEPQTPYEILSGKTVKISGEEAHMAEMLLTNGFASNLQELHRKSLRLTFQILNGGKEGASMGSFLGKPQSVKEMLEEIQQQELQEAQIELVKSKIQEKLKKTGGKNNMEMGDAIMMMTLMNNGQNNNKSGMDINGMLELMKVMNNQHSSQPQAQPAMNFRDIIEVARLMNPQPVNPTDNFKQNIEVVKTIMDQNNKQGMDMQQVLEFLKHKDENTQKTQLEIQKMQEAHNRALMDNKLAILENELQRMRNTGGNADMGSLVEQIKFVKELNAEIGGGEKSASAIDYIESIGKNLSPVIVELLKSKMTANAPTPRPMSTYNHVPEEEVDGMNEQEVVQMHQKNMGGYRPMNHNQNPQVVDIPMRTESSSVIPSATLPKQGQKKIIVRGGIPDVEGVEGVDMGYIG